MPGAPVPATVGYKAARRLAVLDPDTSLLAANTIFTDVVEGAGDADGQVMARDYVWHFSTGSGCAVGCIPF